MPRQDFTNTNKEQLMFTDPEPFELSESDEEQTFVTNNGVKITYLAVRTATKDDPLDMRLNGKDYEAFATAVNQGIDSHLEACFVPDRGDRNDNGDITISPESLPVLIRRLYESSDERANDLATSIMSVLGFNESGKWRRPD